MRWIRRIHLYLGLLVLPWVLLYGITAFLFNHPMAWSDKSTASFGPKDLKDTPLGELPTAERLAAEVVEKLNERQKPQTPYVLAGGSAFAANQFAFATVDVGDRIVRVLLDLSHRSGTIREDSAEKKQASAQRAPFAIAAPPPRTADAAKPEAFAEPHGLILDVPIKAQMEESLPVLLTRKGFPTGATKVTSIPAVHFRIQVGDQIWLASYQPMTGTISGSLESEVAPPRFTLRQFVLKLHRTSGYPWAVNARWFWAFVVDVVAFTMCFWAFSGLIMWWKNKAARGPGLIALLISYVVFGVLAMNLHALMKG